MGTGKIIDLTRTLECGQPGVAFETKFTKERDGWNASTLHLYSHAGTHLDAPLHFDCGDRTVDEMPLESCMGEAHVVDLSGFPERGLIGVEDLGHVADAFVRGDSLLLFTGWSKHFEDRDYYRGNFPRVSEGLATWCAEQGVKMLGVEPPSVADVHDLSEVTRIHEILLGAEIVIVVGLVNLNQIKSDKPFFAAVPLKIKGGDGTPCRAFAIEGELPPLTTA
mgnify:CR=1 FL=1